jgi:7,8-dihydropterin-6-yl-methyl-4-(beta-D-ribofuranosyl)aminobenzene 5'-phosphate synthase
MNFRISPLWWPLLPFFSPLLLFRYRQFRRNVARACEQNRSRLEAAKTLELTELSFIRLKVIVEEKTEPGFHGAPGVSYWLETDHGSLLFDLGFGAEGPSFVSNAQRLHFDPEGIDALVISHLHPDHMGGFRAYRDGVVYWPEGTGLNSGKPVYLPARADAPGFTPFLLQQPTLIPGGMASTGPLSRGLFFMGLVEEQVLIARIRQKGLVVITGCGHPGIELILEMVRRISPLPIYTLCGGFHFPITDSRLNKLGFKTQMLFGTGKPPWQRLRQKDLTKTLQIIKTADIQRILISAHDSCDGAIARFSEAFPGQVEELNAGGIYLIE